MTDGVASTVLNGAQAVSNASKVASLENAVNSVLDFILYPFVAPLLDIFEMCVGDPDALRARAEIWNQVAEKITPVAEDVAGYERALEEAWKGDASERAGAQFAEHEQVMREVAKRMQETARSMEQVASLLEQCEEMIQDIIRELVEWLIVEWIIAQILGPETLGASEAAFVGIEAPATASVAMVRCIKVLNQLRKCLFEFRKLYWGLTKGSFAERLAAKLIKRQIGKTIGGLTGLNPSKFGPMKTAISDAGGYVVTTAAEEFDDRRSGIDGDDDALRRKISKYVDPVADKADPYLDKADRYAKILGPYAEKANDTIPN